MFDYCSLSYKRKHDFFFIIYSSVAQYGVEYNVTLNFVNL